MDIIKNLNKTMLYYGRNIINMALLAPSLMNNLVAIYLIISINERLNVYTIGIRVVLIHFLRESYLLW